MKEQLQHCTSSPPLFQREGKSPAKCHLSYKMEQRNCSSRVLLGLPFFAFSCLLLLSFSGSSVSAYKNYTVGDSLGWYDNSEKPVNYQKWAAGKTFSLGDFLIFNTDTNHSVVQTYNVTTYKLCDYDNAPDDNKTIEWSASNPSNTATEGVTVPVPLLKVGPTYFFSGDYDGDQCRNGQNFQVNVTYGKGLPDDLKDPADQAPAPNAADYDSTPDTVAGDDDFSHPKKERGVKGDSEDSGSGSVSLHLRFLNLRLHGVLILLGFACLF